MARRPGQKIALLIEDWYMPVDPDTAIEFPIVAMVDEVQLRTAQRKEQVWPRVKKGGNAVRSLRAGDRPRRDRLPGFGKGKRSVGGLGPYGGTTGHDDDTEGRARRRAERAKLIEGFTFFDPRRPIEPPDYLVEGIIPKDCDVVFIGGQSGAGKTFLAVYLAVCLATGKEFFGRDVDTKIGTAILAAEAPGSLKNRLHVAAQLAAPGEHLPICYLGVVPDLKNQKEVSALIPRIRAVSEQLQDTYNVPLGLVIIDTLAASFSREDENSNAEAAEIIKVMKEIGRQTGTIVAPVHHFGKAITTGLRGASAYKGGTDVILAVLADIDDTTGVASNRRLALAKTRDDEPGPIAPFDLPFVKLGEHKNGKPFGSCYVKPRLDQAFTNKAKSKKEPESLTTFRQSFAEMTLTSIRAHGDGPEVNAAKISDVRAEFSRRWPTGEDADPKKRADAIRNAFKRGLKEARAHDFATDYQSDIEWIWLVKEPQIRALHLRAAQGEKMGTDLGEILLVGEP
jgi:hypothetical protein